MFAVVILVLWWRLHAFLALLCGAAIVAILCPPSRVMSSALREDSAVVLSVAGDQVRLDPQPGFDPQAAAFVLWPQDEQMMTSEAEVLLLTPSATEQADLQSAITLQASTDGEWERVDQGDRLVSRSDWLSALELTGSGAVDRLLSAFGSTAGKLGVLIALASVLGECLLVSGAAGRIVHGILAVAGPRRLTPALSISSFILAIPVYFDTVFFLLLPLARAMWRQTGRGYLKYVLAIVVGGTLAHSLVPPTPGPVLVADLLDVPLSKMFAGGVVIGLCGVAVGYIYLSIIAARWKWMDQPQGDVFDVNGDKESPSLMTASESSPSLWASIMPLVLPLLLIVGGSITEQLPAVRGLRESVSFLAQPVVALATGTAVAMILLAWHTTSTDTFKRAIAQAVSGAGSVILITSAGGAFGQMIQQSDVAHLIATAFPAFTGGYALLWIAFFVTALIRGVQGSATVAMITSVGILAPLIAAGELQYDRMYIAIAIGCGSKPLAWMNDSGFWVVGQMSGMSDTQTLKTFSVLLTIMGITAMIATQIAVWLLPYPF